MLNWQEHALSWPCGDDRLEGVLAAPAPAQAAEVGVVIVVGGPQYRAGSHRQFVHLARGLARAGVPALRFDVRGMGDSEGQPLGFEQQTPDIASALDAGARALPGVQRWVLFGLCDGASAALMYQAERRDPRVLGLALLNPWVRSAATQARTQVKHYYLQRLRDPAFWRKLAGGGVGLSALGGLLRSVLAMLAGRRGSTTPAGGQADAQAPYTVRMAAGWKAHPGPVLLLMSEQDYTAREFDEALKSQPEWRGAESRNGLMRVDLPGADHTLSTPGAKQAALAAVCDWLERTGLRARHG